MSWRSSTAPRASRSPARSGSRSRPRRSTRPTSGYDSAAAADLPAPWIPGMDAAGIVESVGPDVDRLSVGDEVMAAVSPRRPEGGAQQELLIVPAASVVPIPDGATLAEAATLPMNGLTARLGPRAARPEGRRHAGGHRRRRAARLVRDPAGQGAGPPGDRRRQARGRGAGPELRRGRGRATRRRGSPTPCSRPRPTASTGFTTPRCSVARRSRRSATAAQIVVVRGWDGDEVEDRGIRVHPVMVATVLERTDWLEELRRLASDGRLKLRVAEEFPPEEAAEAERLMDAGGLRGRAVIVILGIRLDAVRRARVEPDSLGIRLRYVRRRAVPADSPVPSTARAALWPGIPLTPPPRRAPAPHSHTFACSVSTPQRADLVVGLGERPGQVAVEDVAAAACRARPRSRAASAPRGTASRRGAQQAVLERLGQRRVERAERGGDRAVAWRRRR